MTHHPSRSFAAASLFVLLLSGCAGGWRNGAPPGTDAPAKSAAAPAASAAVATSGSAVSADGAVFTWKGGGNTVALAGDFNAWNTSADPLTKQADGSFKLVKKLEPGRYMYKFVIDGNTWKDDPSAKESVDDGFGGKNSIVVVGTGGAPAGGAAAAAAPTAAAATPATGDGATFTWKGGGNTVAIAGEFNEWNISADPLAKQPDGTFKLVKKLQPGRYAYKFVIDGTNWKEDPNAKESVDDGFGGKNSLVVIGPATGGAGGGAMAAGAATAAIAGATPTKGKGAPPEITAEGVKFTFAGPAGAAFLAGDFNSWSTSSDPMTRQADGSFILVKKLPSGTHTYKFVADGTTWKVDDSNPNNQDDGFGGKNSVVVVP